jgi:hypothetical protein
MSILPQEDGGTRTPRASTEVPAPRDRAEEETMKKVYRVGIFYRTRNRATQQTEKLILVSKAGDPLATMQNRVKTCVTKFVTDDADRLLELTIEQIEFMGNVDSEW